MTAGYASSPGQLHAGLWLAPLILALLASCVIPHHPRTVEKDSPLASQVLPLLKADPVTTRVAAASVSEVQPPDCSTTFLQPFDTALTWRTAYRSARPGMFHYCPLWSHFGPVRPSHKWHRGLDLAAPSGTQVHAAVDGLLSYSRDPGGWGLFARLRFRPVNTKVTGTCDQADPMELIYAHLAEDSVSEPVPSEMPIRAGTVIGHVGCSGNARGMCSPSPESHLHLTLRYERSHVAIDPIPMLGWAPQTPPAWDGDSSDCPWP